MSIAKVPAPEPALKTMPPLILLLSSGALAQGQSCPAVSMNRTGPPSLFVVTLSAPPNVTWPVVVLDDKLAETADTPRPESNRR